MKIALNELAVSIKNRLNRLEFVFGVAGGDMLRRLIQDISNHAQRIRSFEHGVSDRVPEVVNMHFGNSCCFADFVPMLLQC